MEDILEFLEMLIWELDSQTTNPTNMVPNQSSQPQTAALNPGTVNEQEKRKLIQQQLKLLLHAHKCVIQSCTVPHCATMKDVLAHMSQYQEGRQCTKAHCASSRQIIAHWKNCTKSDCPVCSPLRNNANNNTANPNNATNSLSTGAVGQQPLQQQSNPMPRSASGLANANTTNHLLNNNHSTPNLSSVVGGVGNGQAINMVNSNSTNSYPNSTTTTTATPAASAVAATAAAAAAAVGGPLALLQQQPQLPRLAKGWHEKITTDMRKHLIQKIVQTIFPTQDPKIYTDPRLNNLVSYAVRTECDMYEAAKDQEEYFHLLTERIYKIQKEFEDKQKTEKQMQLSLRNNANNDTDKPADYVDELLCQVCNRRFKTKGGCAGHKTKMGHQNP